MNKYEAAKTLKLTKARFPSTCAHCGGTIEKGAEYFHESLGALAKPPGVRLESYCMPCGKLKGAVVTPNYSGPSG